MAKRDNISEILDAHALAILRSLTAGSCALVDPDDRIRPPREICGPRELAAAELQLLACLLLDVNSWHYAKKRCSPKPTAIVRLQSLDGDATLKIGMGCADWQLLTGKQRAVAFFDPVVDQVRGILKRAFPELASPYGHSLWRAGMIRELKNSSSAS